MQIKLLCYWLLSLSCSLSFAAKPVVAPTKHLSHERNQISVVKVKQVLPDRKFVFENVADLWGKGPELFEVRLEREPVNQIKVGQQLIAAYSNQKRKRIVRDIRETDPKGYRILHISVADYALFSDNENLRFIFANREPVSNKEKHIFMTRVIKEIAHADEQNSALAIFEFNMRTDLYSQLKTENFNTLQTIIESKELSDELKELLLASTFNFPASFKGHWVADTCRNTFKNSGIQLDLVSFRPLLVKTCARLIGRFGSNKDIDALSQLLFSNSPGVAKSAIRTINKLSNGTMIEIAKKTYQNNEVHIETRKVLEQFATR